MAEGLSPMLAATATKCGGLSIPATSCSSNVGETMTLEEEVRKVLEYHMGPDEVLQYDRIAHDLAERIERYGSAAYRREPALAAFIGGDG